MDKTVRINVTLLEAELAEIDQACGHNRSRYLVESALARARGELDVDTALDVIAAAIGRRSR